MTKPAPARLFVLLAREAPIGVIVRRGPSEWVQLIHWDTKTDTFTPGQWFHGHVYADRCDLSFDGSLLVYFASKFTARTFREQKSVWTAVSKPPYFTALKIWFQQGTHGGGGLFDAQNQLWLGAPGSSTPEPLNPAKPAKSARQLASHPDIAYHGPYYYRLERDGWQVTERTNTKYAVPRQWQRQVNGLTLTQAYHYRRNGLHYQYGLTGIEGDLSTVSWADFDQHNRLILAKEGKLFSAAAPNGALVLTELADFNAHQHEPVETPPWAQSW